MQKIFFILLLSCVIKTQAQDPLFKVFDKSSGLSSNTIYNTLIDKNGFVWAAHNKGISRINASNVINYSNNGKFGYSVSNLVELNNTIYCQDFSGNFYYLQKDSLHQETAIKSSGNFYMGGAVKNELVSFGSNYISYFNPTTKKIRKQPFDDNVIRQCLFKNDSFYLNGDNNFIEVFNNHLVYKKTKLNAGLFTIKVGNSFYIVAKSEKPYITEMFSGTAVNIDLPNNTFIQYVAQINNQIWLCTTTGAYCLNNDFSFKYRKNSFLKDYSISNVMQDANGGYWFSTLNNGVIYVPNINININYENEDLTSINVFNNQILVGNKNGLLINSSNNTTTKLNLQHSIDHIMVSNNECFVTGDLFYNYKNYVLNKFCGISVKDVCKYKNSYLLAAPHCLFVYEPNSTQTYNLFTKGMAAIGTTNIFSVAEINTRCRAVFYDEKNDFIYVATSEGLEMLSNTGKHKILYNGKDVLITKFLSDGINIYGTTMSNGIVKIDKNTIEPLQNFNALIIQDACYYNNSIWYLANNSLYVFDIKTKTSKPIASINAFAKFDLKHLVINNNQLYIATNKGLLVADIKALQNPVSKAMLHYDGFVVNNKITNFIEWMDLKETENNLSFQFSSNAYTSNNTLKLEYNLNNSGWIELTNKSELYFRSLGTKKYNVKLRAIDALSIESKNQLEWNFEVVPKFYKTWWFTFMVVGALIALIVFYYRDALSRQEKTNKLISENLELEKELKHSLMASIKSQMNPHFLFNALNTIQSYIYLNDKENATQYLSKFSQLTRNILDQSNNDFITLSEEVTTLKLYVELETMRFEDKLSSHFIVDEKLNLEQTIIPSMLIQPYVENAIKHGLLHKRNDRILTISFLKEENNLKILVDDNGVGREQSAAINAKKHGEHKSFALSANKKRLDILQQQSSSKISYKIVDKKDNEGKAIGTTVVLTMPITIK